MSDSLHSSFKGLGSIAKYNIEDVIAKLEKSIKGKTHLIDSNVVQFGKEMASEELTSGISGLFAANISDSMTSALKAKNAVLVLKSVQEEYGATTIELNQNRDLAVQIVDSEFGKALARKQGSVITPFRASPEPVQKLRIA